MEQVEVDDELVQFAKKDDEAETMWVLIYARDPIGPIKPPKNKGTLPPPATSRTNHDSPLIDQAALKKSLNKLMKDLKGLDLAKNASRNDFSGCVSLQATPIQIKALQGLESVRSIRLNRLVRKTKKPI